MGKFLLSQLSVVIDAGDLGGLRCTSFALSKVSFYVGHMFGAQWEGIPTKKSAEIVLLNSFRA